DGRAARRHRRQERQEARTERSACGARDTSGADRAAHRPAVGAARDLLRPGGYDLVMVGTVVGPGCSIASASLTKSPPRAANAPSANFRSWANLTKSSLYFKTT